MAKELPPVYGLWTRAKSRTRALVVQRYRRLRSEVAQLEAKIEVLDKDRWRLNDLYQLALRNTWQAKYEEAEDEFDKRLNEAVRLAVGAIPPGEHDYMLKQLMTAQKKVEWLQGELRVVRNELAGHKARCKCGG